MRPVPEQTALRVLQATVEEAHGRAGVYVTRDRVMQRVHMEDSEHFEAITEHLEERGWLGAVDILRTLLGLTVPALPRVILACAEGQVASNMGPWVSNQFGGDISNEGTDNSSGRDRRDRRRGLFSPFWAQAPVIDYSTAP